MNLKIKASDWKKKSRRSFILAGLTSLFGSLGFWALRNQTEEEDEVPWPFRRALNFNEKIWNKLFNAASVDENPKAPEKGLVARLNGDIGIDEKIDLNSWRLIVSPGVKIEEANDLRNKILSLEDLKQLPQINLTEVFKCVEGWSQVISYRGIRFSDFLNHYKLAAKTEKAWGKDVDPNQLFKYVGLETPDAVYYVSIDMKSMLHPKTLLVTEMNGEILSPGHGAPLRLIIPVKYGIKNLKCIGRIFFSDEQPPDYWTEQGYDWYAGL